MAPDHNEVHQWTILPAVQGDGVEHMQTVVTVDPRTSSTVEVEGGADVDAYRQVGAALQTLEAGFGGTRAADLVRAVHEIFNGIVTIAHQGRFPLPLRSSFPIPPHASHPAQHGNDGERPVLFHGTDEAQQRFRDWADTHGYGAETDFRRIGLLIHAYIQQTWDCCGEIWESRGKPVRISEVKTAGFQALKNALKVYDPDPSVHGDDVWVYLEPIIRKSAESCCESTGGQLQGSDRSLPGAVHDAFRMSGNHPKFSHGRVLDTHRELFQAWAASQGIEGERYDDVLYSAISRFAPWVEEMAREVQARAEEVQVPLESLLQGGVYQLALELRRFSPDSPDQDFTRGAEGAVRDRLQHVIEKWRAGRQGTQVQFCRPSSTRSRQESTQLEPVPTARSMNFPTSVSDESPPVQPIDVAGGGGESSEQFVGESREAIPVATSGEGGDGIDHTPHPDEPLIVYTETQVADPAPTEIQPQPASEPDPEALERAALEKRRRKWGRQVERLTAVVDDSGLTQELTDKYSGLVGSLVERCSIDGLNVRRKSLRDDAKRALERIAREFDPGDDIGSTPRFQDVATQAITDTLEQVLAPARQKKREADAAALRDRACDAQRL